MKPIAASLMALTCAFTITGCGKSAEEKQKAYFKLWADYLDVLDREHVHEVDIEKAVALRKHMMDFERDFDALPESRKRELNAKFREEIWRLAARQIGLLDKDGDKGLWLQMLIEGQAIMGR